jgi:MFS family permease
MGLGSGALWSAISLGVIERWPGNEYRRLAGVMATYSVGGVAGPALGSIGGIRWPFVVYLGLCAAGVVAVSLVGPPHRHAPRLGSDRSALRHPSYAVSVALMVLVAITIGTLDGVLPLHFDSRLGQAGIAVLFVGVSGVVAAFAIIASRLPLRPTAFVAATLIVAGLAAAGAGEEVWMWAVALLLAGMGFGLAETVSLGYLLDATGTERIVLALVVWNQVFGVGYLVGPSAGGLVAETLGFAAIGLVPLLAAVPFAWSIQRARGGLPAVEARQEA